ncbi:MAG: class I SAM-dependent methyltransferase [Methylococcales bacterium]|jgi:hypothetical protein|nr:class I SAM-dependent methyltransferase [Methylococcales bacterium]MBT7444747.1 class I SAM-dependent methyltransferase [Methylococcales bacterium]
MNDLEKFFENHDGKLIHKWMHYFDIYDRHFSRFRDQEVVIVEFGVSQGGSLQMWKEYFGPKAKIIGIDINEHCKALEEEQVEVMIGDQEDRKFLRQIAEHAPRIDILIDDGGHTMKQQIATFEELFDSIDPNGVYLCEDLHTSYWPKWKGGHLKSSTFIEYSKHLIDKINAWHSKQYTLKVDDFTRSAHSLHYYDSILVIEKRPIVEPHTEKRGHKSVQKYHGALSMKNRLKRWFKRTF